MSLCKQQHTHPTACSFQLIPPPTRKYTRGRKHTHTKLPILNEPQYVNTKMLDCNLSATCTQIKVVYDNRRHPGWLFQTLKPSEVGSRRGQTL